MSTVLVLYYFVLKMGEVDILNEKEISKMIMKIVKSDKKQIAFHDIEKLKRYCKNSNMVIKVVFKKLWAQLKTAHSEIRFSCIQIFDILFMRSSFFRILVIEKLIEYFNLTLGTETVLPPPISFSKKLKLNSLEIFKKWHEIFSPAYKEIDLAKKFLIKNKGIDFESIQNNVSLSEEEIVQKAKLKQTLKDFQNVKKSIKFCINELNKCVNLILQSLNNNETSLKSEMKSDIDFSIRTEKYTNSISELNVKAGTSKDEKISFTFNTTLSQNNPEKIKVYENSNNDSLLFKFSEFSGLLNRHLVYLKQLLKRFSKYQADSTTVANAAVLKLKAQNVLLKANKLEIVQREEEDEEDFVEVRTDTNEITHLMEKASSKGNAKKQEDTLIHSNVKQMETTEQPAFVYNQWKFGDPLPAKGSNESHLPSTSGNQVINRSKDYWRDPVFDKKLSKLLGVDLTSVNRKKKKRFGITDLKAINKNDSKKRLIKIISKSAKKK